MVVRGSIDIGKTYYENTPIPVNLVREIKKSVSVARNKTWKKPGEQSLICGYCEWCKKMLMSDAGGWIVTANKQRFCHDGKDGSCFDKYCVLKMNQQKENNYVW